MRQQRVIARPLLLWPLLIATGLPGAAALSSRRAVAESGGARAGASASHFLEHGNGLERTLHQERKPTQYRALGCWSTESLDKQVDYSNLRVVSVEECFGLCSQKAGAMYFGIAEGDKCWCAAAVEGSEEVLAAKCDKPCLGSSAEKCGGISAASAFIMYECSESTPDELNMTEKVLSSYAVRSGETCGQSAGNSMKVNGAATLVGSVDDCKIACWNGNGGMQCQGFTYDEDTSKCKFHYDVDDGDVAMGETTACYFKVFKIE
mmetsp:Transcript_63044/g.138683  ORF Transcript_63044/g.138683 Transcript_63044/m.138683 type:complete len:263 (+) Transcript_63044:70-858(+)